MNRDTLLAFIVGATIAIPVVVALLIRAPVTFNVVAQTEQLKLTFTGRNVVVWYLDSVDVTYESKDGVPATLPGFSGSFQPAPGARATFVRRSSGPLELTVEVPNASRQSVGVLRNADEEPLDLPRQSRLDFFERNVKGNAKLGKTIYLPVEGVLELGSATAVPSTPSAPILRSATVSLLGRSPFSGDRFNGGVYALDIGDRFEVLKPEGSGQGFVVANENPALAIVFRVVGASGKVMRFGGQGYDISLSLWQLLSNDPIVSTAWIVVGSAVAFFRLIWTTEKKAAQESKPGLAKASPPDQQAGHLQEHRGFVEFVKRWAGSALGGGGARPGRFFRRR